MLSRPYPNQDASALGLTALPSRGYADPMERALRLLPGAPPLRRVGVRRRGRARVDEVRRWIVPLPGAAPRRTLGATRRGALCYTPPSL